jgi:hypothetical protein
MTESLVSRGRLGELDTVVLENEALRVVVIPELGGRIWELEDRARRRQWIWHRFDGLPTAAAAGAAYDEVWAGGWEELFPNDAPGPFEGRELPDHGEWWSARWNAHEITSDRVCLSANLSVVRARCTKEIRLAGATLVVLYRIESLEAEPFHFLFKQHLPLALTPSCRLMLPGGRAEPVDPAFGTLVGAGGGFDWPHANGAAGPVDMSRVTAAESCEREFLYLRDLPEPWCGVDDPDSGATLRMRFDPASLPYVWLFLTYGGWRDCHTAVLEPCTNLPKDLAEAVKIRQSARLEPGSEFMTQVSVSVAPLLPNEDRAPQNDAKLSPSNGGSR